MEEAAVSDKFVDPKSININSIYTPWSNWSRCKRKCKQVRKRYCTVPTICGSNVLKVNYTLDCHYLYKTDFLNPLLLLIL
jgi:hypothetical protein